MQYKNKILFLIGLLGIVTIILIIVLTTLYGPMTTNSNEVEVVIPPGTSIKEIGAILEEANVIRSKNLFYIYVKLYNVGYLGSSNYILNTNMSVKEIINTLKIENNNPNQIVITFKEGIDIDEFINLVVSKTNNNNNTVKTKLKDKSFLNSLIDKYWFITKDILNEDLYHPLEGYLYPNTYFFHNKDVEVETIIIKMLDAFERDLKPLKKEMLKSDYSAFEIITLASIIELEGAKTEDRLNIANVFYNRLNKRMNLGSDVTSYYGVSVKIQERDLTVEEFNDDNPYNTRLANMQGKLPVGPICNPSKDSIIATIRPKKNNYYYFVADKRKKIYFSETLKEHEEIIKTIKNKGDWITW
ncbi:MAG: endolytic transglycosylase MltG [Tenericutes bacterium]|jgi:UPF0755 protein|nr:endolytic transglycosylase MltG [Mycoplasmatota bacterium]